MNRHMRILGVTTLVASAALLAACGNKEGGSGKVLASVNGEAIRESQVDEQIAAAGIPEQLMKGHEAEVKRQILDRLIDQKLIAQEAKKEKIESNPEFQKQMKIQKNILEANFVLANKVSETVTTDMLKAAYEKTKAQRAFPAVKARHILVKTEDEAKALIAMATPQNFEQLAKEKSEGPSKENGGELGWFRKEAMIPEFAKVAFSTPAGTVAKDPVKTQFGWHVILVEDKNDAFIPPFEQVADSLKQELSQQVVGSFVQDLRKGATISYTDQPAGAAPEAPGAAPAGAPAPAPEAPAAK